MKNVSISSGLVCLILLGSAAMIGTFGVIKHQLSAILITGVMYLLAGRFLPLSSWSILVTDFQT